MQSYDNTNVYDGVFEGGCTIFPATDQDYNVKPGQIYRHFKGGFYRILQVAQHESKQVKLVIYQNLFSETDTTVWAREIGEFSSSVDAVKYPQYAGVKRFQLLLDPADRKASLDRLKQLGQSE